jgi:hypothetical protein
MVVLGGSLNSVALSISRTGTSDAAYKNWHEYQKPIGGVSGAV